MASSSTRSMVLSASEWRGQRASSSVCTFVDSQAGKPSFPVTEEDAHQGSHHSNHVLGIRDTARRPPAGPCLEAYSDHELGDHASCHFQDLGAMISTAMARGERC